MVNIMKTYIKNNVGINEYMMYKHVQELNIINIPPIINYNEEKEILETEYIENMNIADLYGEDPHEVPKEVFSKIRTMIKKLYENNIIYPDITGYNFIKYGDNVWIIDFEHAHFIIESNCLKEYPTVSKFLNGETCWNYDL